MTCPFRLFLRFLRAFYHFNAHEDFIVVRKMLHPLVEEQGVERRSVNTDRCSPFPSIQDGYNRNDNDECRYHKVRRPRSEGRLRHRLRVSQQGENGQDVIVQGGESRTCRLQLGPFSRRGIFCRVIRHLMEATRRSSNSRLVTCLFRPIRTLRPVKGKRLHEVGPIVVPFITNFIPRRVTINAYRRRAFMNFPQFLTRKWNGNAVQRKLPSNNGYLRRPLVLRHQHFTPLRRGNARTRPVTFVTAQGGLLLHRLVANCIPILLPCTTVMTIVTTAINCLGRSAGRSFVTGTNGHFFPNGLLRMNYGFYIPTGGRNFVLFNVRPTVTPRFIGRVFRCISSLLTGSYIG